MIGLGSYKICYEAIQIIILAQQRDRFYLTGGSEGGRENEREERMGEGYIHVRDFLAS